MGPTRAEKIRLGLFVLVGVGLLILSTALLSGWDLLTGSAKTYTIDFSGSVGGLSDRSSVRINGVRVGHVTQIALIPDNIEATRVSIAVDPEIPVKKDAVAVLASAGITGSKYVSIRGGTNAAGDLPSGSKLPSSSTFLQDLMSGRGAAGELMDNVADISAILTGKAGDDPALRSGMLGELSVLVKNLAALSAEINHTLKDNRASFKTTGDNVATASASADGAIRSGSEAFNETMASARRTLDVTSRTLENSKLDETVRELDRTLAAARSRIEDSDLDGAIVDLRASLTQFAALLKTVNDLLGSSSDDVRVILTNLRDTSENLAIFSRTIRDDPSVLLTGTDIEPR